jgi:hypothetical protein
MFDQIKIWNVSKEWVCKWNKNEINKKGYLKKACKIDWF